MKCPNCSHVFHYRQAVRVEHNGDEVNLVELAKLTGIAYSTLQNRYRRGDRGEKLVRPADEKYSPHRRADVA
jgi:uncharacterized OB-fold protein